MFDFHDEWRPFAVILPLRVYEETELRLGLRSFEIRFEFESDDSYSNRFEGVGLIRNFSNQLHLPSLACHKPRSLFNKKNFNRCAVVIEIYVILCL